MDRRRELRELAKAECLQLLGGVEVGRIVFTSQALPVALPVNFVLDLRGAGGIVFRTAEGSKMSAATSGSVVAFEVDSSDRVTGSGWSVLVTALAHEVLDPALQRRADSLGLQQWGPSDSQTHYICIPISMISGRRVLVTGVSGKRGAGKSRGNGAVLRIPEPTGAAHN